MASGDDIVQFLKAQQPQPQGAGDDIVSFLKGTQPQAQPSMFGDVVKSGLGGLAQGAGSLAHMAGFDLGGQTLDALGNIHQPQTTAGQYAKTIASFAPSAALTPGGLIARTASAVIPGALSETAGQLTKGTSLEPWARTLGALAGGIGVGVARGLGGKAADTPQAPTVDELKQAASDGYKATDRSGIVISQDSLKNFATQLQNQMGADIGMDETLHPKSMAVLNRVVKDANNGNDGMTFKGLVMLRRLAQDAAGASDDADAFRGLKIKSAIDNYMKGLTPADTLGGAQDPAATVQALQGANQAWHLASQGEDIAELMRRAAIRAGQFSGSGYENALRTEFRRVAMNPDSLSLLDKPVQDAVTKVAMGDNLGNWFRYFGKMAPTGTVSQLGAAALASSKEPILASLPVIGGVNRALATASTMKNAGIASQLSRMTPAQQQLFLASQSDSFFPRLAGSVLPSLLFANPVGQQGSQ